MRDFITLGSTPSGEECTPVQASGDYIPKMKRDCAAWMGQLKRVFPDAKFSIQHFDHDFGRYYEVVVWFDGEDDDSIALTLKIEAEAPEHWDSDALIQLHTDAKKTLKPLYRINHDERYAICPNCHTDHHVELDLEANIKCEGCGATLAVKALI